VSGTVEALVRRLMQSLVALAVLSAVAFALPRLGAGDPTVAMYGAEGSASDRAALRESLGLDRPLASQYARWLGSAARGDFGRSLRDGRPALAAVAERLPMTVALALAALSVGLGLGTALGVVGALRAGTTTDRVASALAAGATAAPGFWIAMLLAYVFAYRLRWLPFGGSGPADAGGALDPLYLLLPALALGLREMGRVGLLLRGSLLSALGQPYARVAAAKGLSRLAVALRHALPNALFPVVGSAGVSLAYLLGGAIAVETVFAWPGIGRLMAESAAARDFPVLAAGILVAGVCALGANLLADVALLALDRRGASEAEDER
jgi:peptide/nickel transport system permease protein